MMASPTKHPASHDLRDRTQPSPRSCTGDQTFAAMQNKVFEFTLNGATDPESDSLTYVVANPARLGHSYRMPRSNH